MFEKIIQFFLSLFQKIKAFFVSPPIKTDIEIKDKRALVNNEEPPPTSEPKNESKLAISFQRCIPNFANDRDTIELRKFINDEFGGDRNGWDLQCTEYVQYKMKQLGIDIRWPVKSNRNGGNWATIFEKFQTYKVLNEPKMGYAACFAVTEKMPYGHIAFVEKVEEDGSIYISEANWPGNGKYFERPLDKLKWQNQYKIRFIDFSDCNNNQKKFSTLGAVPNSILGNKIFLSYSDEDRDLVIKIKFNLEQNNFSVFVAHEDLKLGNKWSEEITNKIRNCRFFLALRTENFYKSTVAEQECGMAMGLDKEIIPVFVDVKIEECGFLRERQGFIFDKQKIEESCTSLASAIKKIMIE